MRAATDLLRRELGEEAFHEVEPRRRGRCEVQVEAWVCDEPVLDRRGLVGRVVIEHEVHRELVGHLVVDALEKLLELDRPVSAVRRGDHSTRGDVERREETGRAGPHVVVTSTLGHTRQQCEDRLGPVQGLNLGLLINAEHHGALGRIEVEANDVAHLVDEERVLGQLEGLDPVRLESEGAPDATDRGLAHARRLGH